MKPASSTTLTEATRAPGATPVTPTPLIAAAMVPATWVPWSEVVGFHAASVVSATPPRQDALLDFTICDARSGWVLEIPLSSTPTTTSALPVVTECACGTPIWVMSHCSPNSGSAVGSPVAAGATTEPASTVSLSSIGVPRPSVDATESTPGPATAELKEGLADRATSTPIWSYAATTVPPAAATRAAACAVLLPAGASTR